MEDYKNEQLICKYHDWLQDIKTAAPELLSEKYSNPYYISIPEGWFDTKGPRIMIVGEEGFGAWGCGKQNGEIRPEEVEKIQRFNFNYPREQCGVSAGGAFNYSAFWRRFRKIAAHGVCSWSNIDKIHVIGRNKCALGPKERRLLHSVNTRILYEELSILNPTHVVFFGWYGTSLLHELPEVYEKLYFQGEDGRYIWHKNVVSVMHEERIYIFTYHPNWGYRQKKMEYEDLVMKVFEDSL